MRKRIPLLVGLAAVASSVLFAADVDKFLKSADGEVIGVLAVGKEKLSITGTIKEVTWTATNAQTVILRWDGRTIVQDQASLTNFVASLVSSGEFCRMRGHCWGTHGHYTLEYAPNRISCRVCQICGLHQEQYATEWK